MRDSASASPGVAADQAAVPSAAILAERYAALKSQIPLLYAAVLANLLGFHLSTKGDHLWDLGIAAPIAILIVYRLIHWRRLRDAEVSIETMRRELRRSFLFACLLSTLFTAWTLWVLVHGSADQQQYAILFSGFAAIGSAIALSSVPRSAMAPLLLIALPMSVWLMLSGQIPYQVVGVSLAILIGLLGRMLRSRDRALVSLLASRAAISAERERALAAHERHRLLGRATKDLIWDWNIATGRVDWNKALHTRMGHHPEEVKPTLDWWMDHIHPEDRPHVAAHVREILEEGVSQFDSEYRFRKADGEYALIYDRGYIIRDEDGAPVRGVGAMQDLTARKKAEQALARSEALNRGIVEASTDGIALIDERGGIVFMNAAAHRDFEVEDAERLRGTEWADLWPVKLRTKVERALAKAGSGRTARFSAERPTSKGAPRWWDVVVSPVKGQEGETPQLVVVTRDVTHQKVNQNKIVWSATHDALTALPNRALFQERLAEALADAQSSGRKACLLHLDLDGFKQVNDTHGHDAGDILLQAFAGRLRALVRPEDTVARLGGDEFAIILPRIDGDSDIPKLAESIFARIAQPIAYGNRSLDCRVSIGASIYPLHGITPEVLLKNADLALYAAKASGRSELAVYQTDMRAEVQKRSSMINAARDAARDERIVPYYQPKIDLRTKRVIGFEALLRWRDAAGALKSPGSISAAFEDLEVASAISAHMVGTVVRDMRRWMDAGLDFGHVAVNAAAAEFRYNNLAERILEELHGANVPTRHLQLEITEQVVLGRGAEHVQRALSLLHDNAVTVALDDFGTGYAALSHLKQFPVDQIKIDQSFVRDLHDPLDAAIVEAMLRLAQSLGIATVAEGVETRAQLDHLIRLNCDQAQGHLFWKAVAAGRVPAVLASDHAARCFDLDSNVKAA